MGSDRLIEEKEIRVCLGGGGGGGGGGVTLPNLTFI